MDWKKLVQLAAPAAAGLASHGQQGAVLRGYMAEQDTIARERRQQAEQDRLHKAQGATMSLELLNRLQGETDPLRFEQLRNVITQNASAYGIDPAQFASMPMPDGSEGRLKELNDLIEKASKQGYDPDELAQSGASLELKDKSRVSVADALAMTRRRPIGANGEMVAPPKKADVSASTDYGRALSRFAKDRGKKVEDLSWADEQQFKKEFGQADDKAATGPTDYTSRYLDNLVSLWKESHPGQTPPASVTRALMQQAKKEVGQADDRPPSNNAPRDRFSVQTVTNKDGSIGLIRVNVDTGEVAPVVLSPNAAGAGRPNEKNQASADFLGRTTASDTNAKSFESSLASLGNQFDVQLPNLLRSEQGQLYRQAQDEFINAGLRDESGAAIQPSEYDRYRAIYFAVPGDKPAALKRKQEARSRVIAGLKTKSGNLAGGNAAPPAVEEWVRDPVTKRLVKKGAQ